MRELPIRPIFATLRRHKLVAVLLLLQVAATCAVVCNVGAMVVGRLQRMNMPSGVDENALELIDVRDLRPHSDVLARQQADLASLRAIAGIQGVAVVDSLPFSSDTWQVGSHRAGDTGDKGGMPLTLYNGTPGELAVLGVKLVAGRDFTTADVQHRGFRDSATPPVIIVTKALADKLYPKGDALGKSIYLDGGSSPSTIVGEVERLQVPATGSWVNNFTWNATIEPVRLNSNFSRYAIRAKPGRLQAAMRAVPEVLYGVNRMRVLDDDSVRSFAQIRQDAYRSDVGMAILMGVVCLILLGVTAAGIVGLTSFWVGQRHRQIGVRRALGARKIDILHYFQAENLLISGVGAVVGLGLAVGLNQLLMQHFEMDRLPVLYVLAGILVVLALGQGAVFVPARRASNVPPVVATRSV